MKAYKGFTKELQCRGFQFEPGATYEEPRAQVCVSGFHAVTNPLDALAYYPVADGSRYCEVEVDDDAQTHDEDSKVASRHITVGLEIGLPGLIKAGLQVVWEKVEKVRAAKPDHFSSGYRSTAASSGDRSTAASSGYQSTAASSGYRSTAASSGYQSTAASSGDQSTAASSGDRSTAASSGDRSTAASSGDRSTAAVTGKESVALAAGYDCFASGAEGCWLVLVERETDFYNGGHILGVKSVKVDGKRIKAGVGYKLVDGKVVPA
jgi:hypothetical protein